MANQADDRAASTYPEGGADFIRSYAPPVAPVAGGIPGAYHSQFGNGKDARGADADKVKSPQGLQGKILAPQQQQDPLQQLRWMAQRGALSAQPQAGEREGVQQAAQQVQPPQMPAWFTNAQQQNIFAHYKDAGFDGHALHQMVQMALGGNKDVAAHLTQLFGSMPDPQMTAWIDAQQTAQEQAVQQAGAAHAANTRVAPPPNTQQAIERQQSQEAEEGLRKLAGQTPQNAMQQLAQMFAATGAQPAQPKQPSDKKQEE